MVTDEFKLGLYEKSYHLLHSRAEQLGGIKKEQFENAIRRMEGSGISVATVKDRSSAADEAGVRLFIVHGDKYLKELLARFRADSLGKEDIVAVQVSDGRRGGETGTEQRSHDCDETTGRRAWVLMVRNHAVLEQRVETLVALLSMNPKDAEAIYRDNLNIVSSELREIFTKQTSATLLTALAILCQGYLAAKAEPGGESGNRHLPDPTKEALKNMGWYQIAGSSLLKPALRGEDEAGLKTLRSDVALADYWAALGKPEDIVAGCAREWLPAGTSEELENLKESEEFNPIKSLVTCSFPIEDSEMVANAYLALHEKLGGPSESAVAG